MRGLRDLETARPQDRKTARPQDNLKTKLLSASLFHQY
jgi:hypothetical protein